MPLAAPLLAIRRALIGAALLVLGAAAPARFVPGLTYTLRSVSAAPTGPGGGAGFGDFGGTWSATVRYANGRGRIDIIEGAQPQLFGIGSFILFDTTGYVVADPSTKTFFEMGADVQDRLGGAMRGTGMNFVLSDVSVVLDTAGVDEVVGGFKTRHLRLKSAYTMKVDMSAMGVDMGGMAPPSFTTSTTAEYWFATDAKLPMNPLLPTGEQGRSSASAMLGGALATLTEKM
jgi:hypothetical protein